MSPNQLWANYDANAVKLKSNFIKYDTSENGVVDFEVYLNCDFEDDSSALIYCRGKIPKRNAKNASLIYIDGYTTDLSSHVTDTFLPKGYSIICFDYKGEREGKKKYTLYPKEYDYANLARSEKHLKSFVNSPKDSCAYVWSQLCRHVITFLKTFLGEDEKIYMLSSLEGGNILWQVAGMDKRVDGIIASDNAGWSESRRLFRFDESPDEFNFSEKKLKWISACSPQAYAKFVTCPVLYISGTNSTFTSVDRVDKTFALTHNKGNNLACLCANLSNTMDVRAKDAMAVWLDSVYYDTAKPKPPTAAFETNEGKLYAKAEIDNSFEIDRIVMFFAYNEKNSELRHWNRRVLSLANPTVEIPLRNEDMRIFAYVSVVYKDNQSYSSLPIMFDLENLDMERIPLKRSHIVYERKKGLDAWIVDNNNGEYFMPELRNGAFDIMGVTAEKGNLSTYSISDIIYEHGENSIFQFDCYNDTPRKLYVEMCIEVALFNYEYYRAEIDVKGKEWQKISLSHNDFKTDKRVPLKDWKNVKKLSFISVNGTLISNIIWV